jgi:hypothetical protein
MRMFSSCIHLGISPVVLGAMLALSPMIFARLNRTKRRAKAHGVGSNSESAGLLQLPCFEKRASCEADAYPRECCSKCRAAVLSH